MSRRNSFKTSLIIFFLHGWGAFVWAQNPPAAPAAPQVDEQKAQEMRGKYTPAQIERAFNQTQNDQPPEIVWYVLPSKVVNDNYGHNVANKYVAIDVTVKNVNPADSIAIKAFRICPLQSDGTDYCQGKDPYKSTDPDLVRGTIEKTQMVGLRNRAVQVIKTTGLMASGAAGYFKAAGPRADYNLGVDIFSNPFEKGIELIFPDTTIRYLAKWDANEVFKNGFIVDAGKEVTGRIFIPIETLCSKTFPSPPQPTEPCQEGGLFRGPRYDPGLIKSRIGRLSILGQHISITLKGRLGS